jgi:uncharacterized membrane protein
VALALAFALVVVAVVAVTAVNWTRRSAPASPKPDIRRVLNPGRWTLLPTDQTGLERGASIRSIARARGTLVAVGIVDRGDSVTGTSALPITEPAVWTSNDDGHRWRRIHSDVFGSWWPQSLVSTDVSVYAFASRDEHTPWRPAVLRTEDGSTWSLLTTEAPAMHTVVARGADLVGLAEGSVFVQNGDPGLWTSTDGRAWQPVPRAPTVFPDGGIQSLVTTGRLMAMTGYEAGPQVRGPSRPVVWWSSDSLHWHLERDLFGGAQVTRMAADADGFVATAIATAPSTTPTTKDGVTSRSHTGVFGAAPLGANFCSTTIGGGSGWAGVVTTWASRDGRAWHQVSRGTAPIGSLSALFPMNGRWYASGQFNPPTGGPTAIVWESGDAGTWTEALRDTPPPPGPCGWNTTVVSAAQATSTGALIVVDVGVDPHRDTQRPPDVWIWSPTAGKGESR